MGKYRVLGSLLDRVFRNNLNANFSDIDKDISTQKKRVDDLIIGNPQPSEIVDSRGGFPVLRDRLENVDMQMAQTSTLENFEIVNKKRKKKAMISFTFDDGYTQDVTQILPLFQSKGISFSMAMVTSKIGTAGYLTVDQLKTLKNNGVEIASHTHNHLDLTTLTEANLIYELEQSKSVLNSYGLDCRNIFIPYGIYNETVKSETKKVYRSARISGSANKGMLNYPPIEMFNVNSVGFGDTTGTGNDTVPYVNSWIDQAVSDGAWLVVILHSKMLIDNGRLGDLTSIIDYALSKNIEIVTYNEGLNLYGNLVEGGNYNYNNIDDNDRYKEYEHFALGADGKITSNRINTKFQKSNITNTTTIDKFEMNICTITPIYSAGATNFPEGRAGMLYTYRWTRENLFCYQMYKLLGKNVCYTRYANSDGTWGTWFKVYDENAKLVEYKLNLASTHKPSELAKDAITYSNVATASATGYPDNVAGYLTANNYGTNITYAYETYRKLNSNKLYFRYAIDANTWSDWSALNDEQNISIKALNAFSAANVPNDFPKDKITTFPVNTAGGTGMPNNKAGVVVHNPLGSIYSFYFQEFHEIGTINTWKRISTDGTAWGAWAKVSV